MPLRNKVRRACCTLMWLLSALFYGAAVAQASAGGSSSQTQFAEGEALAKSKNCLGCHQLDSKRVGPSYQSVAKRYASLEAANRYLASSIQQGGANRWGAVPMPAQPQVSAAEAELLANWILSLAISR
jgi:cytochrome c